ncbi:alpha-mannosidase [Lederbergia sp. NSJ-179]|uniref:alpha-mannosidase n=1 Tax=Lederbergia sp. NSJ-179 TaxID=2931402 RepID=UPI001FD520E5|nr:alpha-mannosidase [Lederbergia sp. NSJ-179]MCJ7840610.1 alpha-mannosidase [Lederbergia sp. NSJ-179]
MYEIHRLIHYLKDHLVLDSIAIENWKAKRAEYTEPVKYTYKKDAEPETINVGDHLIVSGETMFLENEIDVPPEWTEQSIGLEFLVGQPHVKTNHEALLSIDGKPYHGIDRNRSFVPFPEDNKLTYHVQIELFNPVAQVVDRLNFQNEPAEHSPAPLSLLQSELVCMNVAVENLLFTVKAYFEAAQLLPDGDLRKSTIIKTLTSAANQIQNETPDQLKDQEWVRTVESGLLKELEMLEDPSTGKIHMVGQSHIDLAWLWPVKEAVRKCSRTFSTMSTLLDQFPEFGYVQSQPQAFAFMKEHYPDIYERVKQHIANGRWELVGGMWVEPDLNIPSGESLVRQLLYGMNFYQEEFGVKPRIEWLPDTFGYCASLPQLLQKAGLEYFMTTKMNWNDTNQFPYDLFHWVGIDGTSMIAYLNHGVNEYTHPKEIKEHWDSYKQKAEHPEQMLLYGHGDGGGGVTREMIKYVERSKNLPGLPTSTFSTAHQFFDGIKEANPALPAWNGDMYLELHRGTYTTQAHNKRWNRKAEVLYREAEIWGSFATYFDQSHCLHTLHDGWKLLLLNQFHDIIPGTSIPEVYVKSESDYKKIFQIGHDVKENALQVLEKQIDTKGDGTPIVVFNSLSWTRSETVTIKGGHELETMGVYDEQGNLLESDIRYLDENQVEMSVHVPAIPEMGYCTIWLKEKNIQDQTETPTFDGHWETEYYQVEWNENGEISRLYDKQANREVLKLGETANQLQFFHDRPPLWDAWDIDPRFESQVADQVKLQSIEVIQKGKTKDILRFKWSVSNSFIEQDMIFHHHSRRIDFATKVEWKEEHKLLKVAFPVDVLADKATFEIPFGTVERATHNNTSWETAQYEVCGHRFADLSEGDYGVSLLNDCKYGYDVKGHVLRLSLLRSPKWPDPQADIGSHTFTYSLYPHRGNWREANITRKGYELNHPVTVVVAEAHAGSLPNHHSFMKTEAEHVVLDTVKPAEDENGFIVRLYEATGGREQTTLHLQLPIDSAEETNLLEEPVANLTIVNGQLRTEYKPYEVKTMRLKA